MPKRPYKICDGTWKDYHRHRRRGEVPCSKSKQAHRKYTMERRNAARRGDAT